MRFYLVMSMEAPDIYIFIRTSVSTAFTRMHVLVFYDRNSRAKKWKTF